MLLVDYESEQIIKFYHEQMLDVLKQIVNKKINLEKLGKDSRDFK